MIVASESSGSIEFNIFNGRVTMEKEEYKELFIFAAKAGALEGYLFGRKKVEQLDNWIDNIGRMYQELPVVVRREVDPVLTPVLRRILEYGEKMLESGPREKLEQMLVASSAGLETEKAG